MKFDSLGMEIVKRIHNLSGANVQERMARQDQETQRRVMSRFAADVAAGLRCVHERRWEDDCSSCGRRGGDVPLPTCKHEHIVWVGAGKDRKCGFCLKEGLALATGVLQYLHDTTVLAVNSPDLKASEVSGWIIVDQKVFPVLTELKNRGLA